MSRHRGRHRATYSHRRSLHASAVALVLTTAIVSAAFGITRQPAAPEPATSEVAIVAPEAVASLPSRVIEASRQSSLEGIAKPGTYQIPPLLFRSPLAGERRADLAAARPDIDVLFPPAPGSALAWRPLVERYFQPEDVDLALRIMQCESRGKPRAWNYQSKASGLFQHLPEYWPLRSYLVGFFKADIYDPEANIAAAAWLVYDAGGWGPWRSSESCWSRDASWEGFWESPWTEIDR